MDLALNDIYDISYVKNTPVNGDIYGTFTDQAGQELRIPAFHNGGSSWIVRFSANSIGKWQYSIIDDTEVVDQGIITCITSKDNIIPGPISIMKENTRYFQRDNKPFMMNCYECDWLFALWMTDNDVAMKFIDKIASYKFNTILMNVYAHACDWTDPATPDRFVPPPLYPWEGSNEKPEFDKLNFDFFNEFDKLISYMCKKGVVAHLMIFVYNKLTSWPAKRSKEEEMYISQIVARYQAFSNVIWDLAKEAYYIHPDISYAGEKLLDIKRQDAYQRLITVQDYKEFVHSDRYTGLVDFSSLQQHVDIHTRALMEHEKTGRPVLHAEFGYESGADGSKTYKESLPLDDFIHRAYQALLAGAGICYYYTYTGWDVIRPNDNPPGHEAFKRIYEFFETFDWWNYNPNPDFCFWTPTTCYTHKDGNKHIINTNHHGEFLLPHDLDEVELEGTWFNMTNDETKELTTDDYASYTVVTKKQTRMVGPYGKYTILKLTIKNK